MADDRSKVDLARLRVGAAEPLTVGVHGFGSTFGADDALVFASSYSSDPSTAPDFQYTPYACQSGPGGVFLAQRESSGTAALSTIEQPEIVELVYFGKVHRYHRGDYPTLAPAWFEMLKSEYRILLDSLNGQQAIARQYLEGDGSLGAGMTHALKAVSDLWKSSKAGAPKPEEYDSLTNRTVRAFDRMRTGGPGDYPALRAAGIEFHAIRNAAEALSRRVQRRVGQLIETAERGQAAAEEIEGTAAWLWDIYAQTLSGGSETRLAVYRCGIMLARAATRGAAGYLVADRETAAQRVNAQREAWRYALEIVRAELPKTIKGLLLSGIRKGFQDSKRPLPWEQVAEELIGLQIWVVGFTIDFYVFEAPALAKAGGDQANAAYIEKLIPALAGEIVGAGANVVGARRGRGLSDEAREALTLKIDLVAEMIRWVIDEMATLRHKARQEQRPLLEVVGGDELGWAIVRLVRNLAKKVAEPKIRRAMEKGVAADRRYYAALILRVWLELRHPEPIHQETSKREIRAPAPPVTPPRVTQFAPEAKGEFHAHAFEPAAAVTPAPLPKREVIRQTPRIKAAQPSKRRYLDEVMPHDAVVFRDAADGHCLVIRAWVRPSDKRRSTERSLWEGRQFGYLNAELGHSQGAWLGAENAKGILLVPVTTNQIHMKAVEKRITAFRAAVPPGWQLRLTTRTRGHQRTMRLRRIDYLLELVGPAGQSTAVYRSRIEVPDLAESAKERFKKARELLHARLEAGREAGVKEKDLNKVLFEGIELIDLEGALATPLLGPTVSTDRFNEIESLTRRTGATTDQPVRQR